jgi:8-oxo-dGTP pyrophosphatase MutT (NUDIX family)
VEVLVTTSLSSRRWILPKGNPEGDPSLAAAAARESYEETGVLGPVEGEPLGAYHYERSRLGQRFKVYVFPQQVTERHDRFPEQGQRHSRWVEPQTAAEMVEEPELAHLLRIFAANPPKIG